MLVDTCDLNLAPCKHALLKWAVYKGISRLTCCHCNTVFALKHDDPTHESEPFEQPPDYCLFIGNPVAVDIDMTKLCPHVVVQWMASSDGVYRLHCASCDAFLDLESYYPVNLELFKFGGSTYDNKN